MLFTLQIRAMLTKKMPCVENLQIYYILINLAIAANKAFL